MKTILEYLQEQDCNFIAPCNGQKKCGKCKVKATNRIIEVNHDDLKLLTKKELDQGYRLACSHLYHRVTDLFCHKQTELLRIVYI